MERSDMVAFAAEAQRQQFIGAVLETIVIVCAIVVIGTLLYMVAEDWFYDED